MNATEGAMAKSERANGRKRKAAAPENGAQWTADVCVIPPPAWRNASDAAAWLRDSLGGWLWVVEATLGDADRKLAAQIVLDLAGLTHAAAGWLEHGRKPSIRWDADDAEPYVVQSVAAARRILGHDPEHESEAALLLEAAELTLGVKARDARAKGARPAPKPLTQAEREALPTLRAAP
jgi:hypothetical protein